MFVEVLLLEFGKAVADNAVPLLWVNTVGGAVCFYAYLHKQGLI